MEKEFVCQCYGAYCRIADGICRVNAEEIAREVPHLPANWKPRASEATARKSSRHLACFGAAAKYARKDVAHDLDEMRESVSRGRKARYAELAKERGFV